MRFWIVLLILGWRLRWLAKNNDAFKEKLENKDFVLQFRTASGRVGRFFVVRNEQIKSCGGIDSAADLCLSFKDAAFAFETIKQAAKDKTVFMQGIAKQDIIVTGDEQQMMWFMSIMKFLPPRRKK